MRTARIFAFGGIGFCLVWLLSSVLWGLTLQRASASMFTEQARRFQVSQPLEASLLQECVAEGAVLYGDLGEESNLRGIWFKADDGAPFPMMDGSFFTPPETQGSERLAVAGSLVLSQAAKSESGDQLISLDGADYILLGVTGIQNLSTPLDSLILIPMECACEVFSHFGPAIHYTLDGSSNAIAKTIAAFESHGVTMHFTDMRTMHLGRLYAGDMSIVWMYLSFAGLVCAMLILCTWFEVHACAQKIQVYQTAGSTVWQTIRLLMHEPVKYLFLALAAGCLLGWILWGFLYGWSYSSIALLFGGLVCFACLLAATLMAFRAVNKHISEKHFVSFWPRRCASIVLLCTCTFVLVFLNVESQALASRSRTHSRLIQTEEQEFCQLMADETSAAFDQFLMEPNAVERLKFVYETLKEQSRFPYLVRVSQPIGVQNITLPADFWNDPEAREYVHSLQVNEEYFPAMHLDAHTGRLFQSQDFEEGGDSTLPAVLGAAYNEYFDVGDIIHNVDYLGMTFSVEVIGFLEPGAYDTVFGYPELLDYHMILPAVEYRTIPPYGSEQWDLQRWAYDQRLDGGGFLMIQDPQDRAAAAVQLAQLSTQYGIRPFYLGGPTSSAARMSIFVAMSAVYVSATQTAVFMAAILTMLLYIIIAQYLFVTDRDVFEAYRLSGASFGQLLWRVAAASLPIILGANLTAWTLTHAWLGLSYVWWLPVTSIAAILACVAVSMRKTVQKEFIG